LTIQIQYFTQNIKLVYNLIHLFPSTGETYFSANIKVISNKRPLECIANMSEVHKLHSHLKGLINVYMCMKFELGSI